jgi:hypothetical protein
MERIILNSIYNTIIAELLATDEKIPPLLVKTTDLSTFEPYTAS